VWPREQGGSNHCEAPSYDKPRLLPYLLADVLTNRRPFHGFAWYTVPKPENSNPMPSTPLPIGLLAQVGNEVSHHATLRSDCSPA
jgi:hypothetical protein